MQLPIALVSILLIGYVNARFGIVQGDDTTIEEFPFAAVVLAKMTIIPLTVPGGAGVIVGPRSILTAAHVCEVGNLFQFDVRVGSTDNTEGGDTMEVQNYTMHPKYNNYSLNYDFCMMHLKNKITFDKTKQPAVLPNPTDKLKDGDEVVAAGWGTTLHEESSKTLQKVTLQKISNKKCQKDYPKENVTNKQWCAMLEGSIKKTFKGDSGGPVIGKKDKKLYGLVSWGTANTTEIAADVYSNVQSELNWIKSFIV